MKKRNLWETFLNLLYPPKCAYCGRLTGKPMGEPCESCAAGLPLIPAELQVRSLSADLECCSPLYYEGTARESFLRYKFGGKTAYFQTYSKLIAKCVDENGFTCDTIGWIPLSKKRLRKRGYDQAYLLASGTARLLGLPCRPVLKKVRDNRAQSSTSDEKARRENVRGVYAAVSPEKFAGKRLLLIDDIVTTGSTLTEAAAVLKAAGAAEVKAATLARRERTAGADHTETER